MGPQARGKICRRTCSMSCCVSANTCSRVSGAVNPPAGVHVYSYSLTLASNTRCRPGHAASAAGTSAPFSRAMAAASSSPSPACACRNSSSARRAGGGACSLTKDEREKINKEAARKVGTAGGTHRRRSVRIRHRPKSAPCASAGGNPARSRITDPDRSMLVLCDGWPENCLAGVRKGRRGWRCI